MGEILSGPDAPVEAFLYMGRALHALGAYGRSLACFDEYIRVKSRSWLGYFFAGRCCLSMGMPEKALGFLKKALELRSGDPGVMAFLGIAYLKSHHSQLAVDLLQEAVETAAKKTSLNAASNKRIYRAYINALLVRGIRLCRNEEYDLGRQMLRFVLENGGPNTASSTILRLELGRSCRELGLLEEALDHYTKALAAVPDDRRIRWYRASVLMEQGRQNEAMQEIRAIRKVNEKDNDLPWNSETVDLLMIRSFLETGEWRLAAEACRDWLRRRRYTPGAKPNPQDAVIHTMYAEAMRRLKNYEAALNHLDRAAEIDGQKVQIWYERILVAWESENWKLLKSAIVGAEKRGGDRELTGRFSILLEGRTGTDDLPIIGRLQEAIRRLGPDPDLLYALGERYLRLGLIPEALRWFKMSLRLQPDHERSWLGQMAALEALLVADPASGLLARGEQLLEIRPHEQNNRELKETYAQYLQRWSDNYVIRREQALYLLHCFEYEEAAKDFELLLAREPSNPSLRRVLAYCYRKTGRYREAALFIKTLLKEKPRNVELILEYSGCLERAGAGSYALAVLESAALMFKNSADISLARGLIHSRHKNTEKAFDCFREAIRLAPGDDRPWHCMAALARSIGDITNAEKYEQKAKKTSPGALSQK